MPKYLWFRAFNRRTTEELLEVLYGGDIPNPDVNCTTRLNERTLGIDHPCVYAYLGQTLAEFGRFGVSLPQDQLEGQVSPFDTGGLVAHVKPFCNWQVGERADALRKYSWTTDKLPDVLEVYPGDDPARVAAYLRGDRPHGKGLHERIANLPEADAWVQNDHWRAWIWEGRAEDRLEHQGLFKWTCPPEVFADFQKIAPRLHYDRAFLIRLTQTYVPGGVSALVDSLRAYQETA